MTSSPFITTPWRACYFPCITKCQPSRIRPWASFQENCSAIKKTSSFCKTKGWWKITRTWLTLLAAYQNYVIARNKMRSSRAYELGLTTAVQSRKLHDNHGVYIRIVNLSLEISSRPGWQLGQTIAHKACISPTAKDTNTRMDRQAEYNSIKH